MRCPRCADAQPDDGRFCSRCGAELAATTPVWQGGGPGVTQTVSAAERAVEPDRRSVARAGRLRRVAPWIAGALVVGGVGLGSALIIDRLGDTDEGAVGAEDGGLTTAAAAVPPGSQASTTSTDTAPAASTVLGSAVTTLRATADADAPVVEALVGQWVAQVSQRRVGVRNNGVAAPAGEIVAVHADLQQRVGAVLLNSSDYVFKTDNMWVSIVPEGFATANEALDRCATLLADQPANQLADQPCIARLITHDASIAVTSKQRRP